LDRTESLRRRDKAAIWHPFTQMADWEKDDPIVIERGDGNYLYDTDGNRYFDGVSSLWVNLFGHRRKEIDAAVRAQLDLLAHSTFLGLSHPPAIELAEKLLAAAPAATLSTRLRFFCWPATSPSSMRCRVTTSRSRIGSPRS